MTGWRKEREVQEESLRRHELDKEGRKWETEEAPRRNITHVSIFDDFTKIF